MFCLGTKFFDVEEVYVAAQINTWNWIHSKYGRVNFSYSDWCLNLQYLMSIK